MEYNKSHLQKAVDKAITSTNLPENQIKFIEDRAKASVSSITTQETDELYINLLITPHKETINPVNGSGVMSSATFTIVRKSDGEVISFPYTSDHTDFTPSRVEGGDLVTVLKSAHKESLFNAFARGDKLGGLDFTSYRSEFGVQYLKNARPEDIVHRSFPQNIGGYPGIQLVSDRNTSRASSVKADDFIENFDDYPGELYSRVISTQSFLERFDIDTEHAEKINKAYLNDDNQIKAEFESLVMKQIYPHLPLSLTADNIKKYQPAELCFILAGEGDAKRYRKEFIDRTHDLLGVDNTDRTKSIGRLVGWRQVYGSSNKEVDVEKSAQFYSHFLKDQYGRTDDKCIDIIDSGRYPIKHIVEKHGFGAMSKKQFTSAMNLLTLTPNMPWIGSFENCLSLAKIPKEWLIDKPGGKVIFEIPKYATHDMMLRRLAPSLQLTGKLIDEAQVTGDKRTLKQLSDKWKWLSKQDGRPLHKRLDEVEKKNKADTLDDFGRLCTNLMEGVIYRVLQDHPSYDLGQAVELVDEVTLVLHVDILKEKYKEWLDSDFDPDEYVSDQQDYHLKEYGEEIDYDSVEVIYPSEDVDDIHELSAREFNNAMKTSIPSYKDHLEANVRAHNNDSKLRREIANFSTENIEWGAFIDEPCSMGPYFVEAISDKKALLNEANEMDHCVFSYLPRCLSGDSIILSIKDKVSGQHVATAELSHQGDDDYRVEQLYGFKNSNVDGSVRKLMDEFIEKIALGDIPVNDDIAVTTDLTYIEDDPLQHGTILSTVPYDTDAAYLALFALENNMPKGFSFDEFLSKHTGSFTEIWYKSTFKESVDNIRELAVESGIKPIDVVRTKARLSLDKFTDVPEAITKENRMKKTIDDCISEYSDALEPEQLSKKINSVIDGLYGVTFLREELENALMDGKEVSHIVTGVEYRDGWYDHDRQQVTLFDAIERSHKIEDRESSQQKLAM
jgi:hypothetical protein